MMSRRWPGRGWRTGPRPPNSSVEASRQRGKSPPSVVKRVTGRLPPVREMAGIASEERADGRGATKTSPTVTKATLVASEDATASTDAGRRTCSRRSAPSGATETRVPPLTK